MKPRGHQIEGAAWALDTIRKHGLASRPTIWSNVINHPGYYVSIDGDVVSAKSNYDGRVIPKWKRLKLRLEKGYVSRASLSSTKRIQRFSPHQLVGMHYPVGGAGKQINHKNGIRNDNRVENLEWCTPKENEMHAWKVLGKSHSISSNKDRSKTLMNKKVLARINVQHSKEVILEVLKLGSEGIGMHHIASQVGISHSTPSRIIRALEIGIFIPGTKQIKEIICNHIPTR
jgi:uncharacterized protein YerC